MGRKRVSTKTKRFRQFFTRTTILITLVFVMIMSGYLTYKYFTEIVNRTDEMVKMQFPDEEKMEIVIPLGSGTDAIANILLENGVIKSSRLYKIISKVNGFDGKYKSGVHIISRKDNYNTLEGFDNLMRILSSKPMDNPTITVTIPEGYTFRQTVDIFVEKGLGSFEDFEKAIEEHDFGFDFLKGLPESKAHKLEGYLYPETYIFDTTLGPKHVLGKMLSQFNIVFSEEYRERAKELGMSIEQVITLASIIEREAQVAEERETISSVFYNRLKSADKTLNLLQSCATIQYIFLEKEGVVKEQILEEHTKIDNPYNTYMYSGLPPGPICSPGKGSIMAALYPDDTNYLYFVAKGNGAHEFNSSYRDHVNAMNKYGQRY